MKIKHVEELVGITRKNIRFYEEQGLLTPGRAENGYREYGQEDIERLKKIKLLRKLGVSLEEIDRLFAGTLRLDDCLDHHLDVLEQQKESLTRMQALAERIATSHFALQEIDTDSYLEQVERMEKEGMQFMDVEKKDQRRKKRTGALAAGVAILVLGVIVPIVVLLWINAVDPVPSGVLFAYVLVSLGVGVAVIVALVGRMKEIEGGEEDEAAKY